MNTISYSYFRSPASIYEKIKQNAAVQFEQFLGLIVRAHHVVWPGWRLLFSVDDEVRKLPYWPKMVAFDREKLLEIRYHGPCQTICGIGGMLERMRPLWDGYATNLLCRDVDSIPSPRERRMVEEWIDSDKAVHVIHDAPQPHAGAHAGVMGGTLGVKCERFRNLIGFESLETFIASSQDFDFNKQGADQHLLNRYYPRYASGTLLHSCHRPETSEMNGCEWRRKISKDVPSDIPAIVAEHGDSFCRIVGGCDEPAKALEFYRNLDIGIIRKINRIESEA